MQAKDEVLPGTDLHGKHILVTGVSAAIAVETASTLAAHGACHRRSDGHREVETATRPLLPIPGHGRQRPSCVFRSRKSPSLREPLPLCAGANYRCCKSTTPEPKAGNNNIYKKKDPENEDVIRGCRVIVVSLTRWHLNKFVER